MAQEEEGRIGIRQTDRGLAARRIEQGLGYGELIHRIFTAGMYLSKRHRDIVASIDTLPVPAVQLQRYGGADMPHQVLRAEFAVTPRRQANLRSGLAG